MQVPKLEQWSESRCRFLFMWIIKYFNNNSYDNSSNQGLEWREHNIIWVFKLVWNEWATSHCVDAIMPISMHGQSPNSFFLFIKNNSLHWVKMQSLATSLFANNYIYTEMKILNWIAILYLLKGAICKWKSFIYVIRQYCNRNNKIYLWEKVE